MSTTPRRTTAVLVVREHLREPQSGTELGVALMTTAGFVGDSRRAPTEPVVKLVVADPDGAVRRGWYGKGDQVVVAGIGWTVDHIVDRDAGGPAVRLSRPTEG